MKLLASKTFVVLQVTRGRSTVKENMISVCPVSITVIDLTAQAMMQHPDWREICDREEPIEPWSPRALMYFRMALFGFIVLELLTACAGVILLAKWAIGRWM